MGGVSGGWLVRLRGAGGAEPVASAVEARDCLGDGPVAWAVAVAGRMTDEVVREVPDFGGGVEPVRILRRAVEASVLAALVGLVRDAPPAAELVPDEAVEGNADLARRGVPLDRVLRGVRIGHACLHRALMDAVERESEPVRTAERHRVSELLFAYADVHASRMAEEYIAERDRWQAGTAAARRRLVDELLDGRPVDVRAARRTLGYDLRGHHVAFLVGADASDAPAETLRHGAAKVAGALGGTGLLVLPAGRAELWAWAGSPGPVDAARAEVGVPAGLRVALGPCARGVDGFRRSHRGAREARRLAGGARLVRFRDVRVRSLVTADEERARWFAAETLGGLAGDDDRARDLRETLRVYLACGRSPQLAAERLHVSRNTVTYRVRRAEELLGRPLAGDLLELRLALEIIPALAALSPTPASILGRRPKSRPAATG